MIPSNGGVVLSALALLGTAGVLLLALLVAGGALLQGRTRLAGRVLLGGGGVALLYLVVLAAAGLASRRTVVPPGGEKYFCELDCHLAYSVREVRALDSASSAGSGGRRWAVVLRTRFDERTISPRRPRDAPLSPNPRLVRLVDGSGGRHAPLAGGADALAAEGIVSTPLSRELRPGESYQTVLLFELPEGTVPAGLLLQEADPITRLLIGHERSLFHAPEVMELAGR